MTEPERVRILYLDHGTKPVGGGQINTLSLIRHLDRLRFTPIVLSAQENAFTRGARASGADVRIMPMPAALTRLGRLSVRYEPWQLMRYGWHVARAALRVSRMVGDERIDILHPCDNLMRVVSAVVATLRRVPVVCPIMEEFTPSLTSRVLRRLITGTMTFVLPVSERVAVFFREGPRRRAQVVVTYTGIELDQFSEEVAVTGRREREARFQNTLVVGIVGRLIPIKGHRELFRALAMLQQARPGAFHCMVVGDGPDRETLGALARALHVEDQVSFVAFQQDVAAIMSQMDVVAVPSHTEASSRVVLEAGALRIPSIATRVGGIPEMVVDGVTGILVDLGDIAGLARAIETMTDAGLRRRMGEAAHRRVRETFDNAVIVKHVEDIYLRALTAGRDAA